MKRDAEPTSYTITLNNAQLRIIQNALEEYFRLRMGQTWDLSDDLAFQHFDYKNHTEDEFNDRLKRRDECRKCLDLAMKAADGGSWEHWKKTEKVITAMDMWSVIRHFFWMQRPKEERNYYSTDAGPVFLWGPEPGIKVEKR